MDIEEDENTRDSVGFSALDLNEESGPSSISQIDVDSDNDNESSAGPTILNGKFFKIVYNEAEGTDSSDNITASCVKCEPNLVTIKGSKKSTSNFISHLKRRHGQETFDEYQNYKGQCRRRKTSISKNVSCASKQIKKSQKTLNEKIVRFVIHSLVPLRVVENPYFQEMFASSNSLTVPSRRQLGREINKLYTCHVQEIKEKLKSAAYICTLISGHLKNVTSLGSQLTG